MTGDEVMKPIPEMMFAQGEEPLGVRVLTYQSSEVTINRILSALDVEEVDYLRRFAFGKFIEIGEQLVFSGRFGRFLLSRQLKTKKKHEIWFRFAGKPVRFSLREFAIVIGLPCGRYPRNVKTKMKETMSEESYWPTLFGKRNVVTVHEVMKMLLRRSGEDRIIRIKYACLVILSAVILPTSLKMKIAREHAEAIEDLDEFFKFPWGRMAFDLLITSIKERDEIALSQNNIALKGFAHAIQLVMVQAVPAITEVGQDFSYGSEGESEFDVDGGGDLFPKKRTLNPAHARSIDKKCEVKVRSILLDDPMAPIDEDTCLWSDEEADEKVDNLFELIRVNYNFNLTMFVGGVTKVDVLRMIEAAKQAAKKKKGKKSACSRRRRGEDVDSWFVASIVFSKIKPELDIMDKNIKSACAAVDDIESRVAGLIQSVIVKFKDEILHIVKEMVSNMNKTQVSVGNESNHVSHAARVVVSASEGCRSPAADANHETIHNVLDNLSEYSTPPRSKIPSQGDNSSPPYLGGDNARHFAVRENNHNIDSMSAHSQNQCMIQEGLQQLGGTNVLVPVIAEIPSFSLGLTQENIHEEEQPEAAGCINVNRKRCLYIEDNGRSNASSRKSKRQKTVPASLIDNYHCGPHIHSRVRESHKKFFVSYDKEDVARKYDLLLKKLRRTWFIKVCGLSVSSKDIKAIFPISQNLTSKSLDILIRLLDLVGRQREQNDTFADTKLGAAFQRTYPKFMRRKNKATYNFPKEMSCLFHGEGEFRAQVNRVYFPLNVGNNHWVGVCFHPEAGVFTILDSNIGLTSKRSLEKLLTPFLHMMPYIARIGSDDCEGEVKMVYDVARPKDICQSKGEVSSGHLAVLLIANHALYGMEMCRYLNADIVSEELKSAAIMAYELKEKL